MSEETAQNRHYARKRREKILNKIDSRVVRFFLEPFPPTFFMGEYWVGLLSGLILGFLFGGGVL